MLKFSTLLTLVACLLLSLQSQAGSTVADSCHQALTINCGDVIVGTTLGATFDTVPECGTTNTSPSVWYTFEGDGGTKVISLCGSSYDTKLSVFEGRCDTLNCIVGNDDECGLQSEVSFVTIAGKSYSVMVHGFLQNVGEFELAFTCLPPANDSCKGAIPVECHQLIQGTTVGATVDDEVDTQTCGTFINSPGVWYTMQGTGYLVDINTCNRANFNTKISIFSGTSCDSLVCVDGNNDYPGCSDSTSKITFQSVYGLTYYILVHSFLNQTGTFLLDIACVGPPNDSCNNAYMLEPGVTDFTTESSNGVDMTSCGTNDFADVWYVYTSDCDESVTISTCDSASFDTHLSVFTDCAGTNEITCNDDFSGCGFQSQISFNAIAGVPYYVRLSGWNGNTGIGQLRVIVEPPLNDQCGGAVPVSCGDVITGCSDNASDDNQPDCGTTAGGAGLWYSLIGEGDSVNLSLCNSDYDTKIHVFSGTCGAFTCITGNDDDCSLQSNVSFLAQQGTLYYVMVGGFLSATGNFELEVSCSSCPVPTNLDAILINDKKAELTWDCDPGAYQYEVRGNRVGAATTIALTLPQGCPAPFRINGLQSNTQYWWQIRTYCDPQGSSISDWSVADTFWTLCTAPDTTFASNIAANSARLNWARVNGVQGYQIRGRRVGAGSWQNVTVNNGSASGLNTGNILQANTTYEWQIRTICAGGGNSAYSPLTTFSTLPARLAGNLHDEPLESEFTIYPNPAAGLVNIAYNNLFAVTEINLQIFDSQGKMMHVEHAETSNFQTKLNTSAWASGLYQVVLNVNGKTQVRKLVVR